MFTILTFQEWNTFCAMLERAMAYDIPDIYPFGTLNRHELIDELAEVHGLLMERPLANLILHDE